jgi:hypothetical protein
MPSAIAFIGRSSPRQLTRGMAGLCPTRALLAILKSAVGVRNRERGAREAMRSRRRVPSVFNAVGCCPTAAAGSRPRDNR